MKLIYLLAFLSVAVLHQALCDDDHCTSNLQCAPDECCAWNTFKTSKSCKDIGDDVGDRCGGDYKCGCSILRGLTCVEDTSFLSNFKRGTGTCHRLAYGK